MGIKSYQVIRALWGNNRQVLKEIPFQPLFNDVVFVWGLDNYYYLSSLNYKCVLMSDDDQSSLPADKMYFLKPQAWVKGCEMFGSVLFLDWDISVTKSIDDYFWQSFDGKEFCAPLYAYPSGIEKQKHTFKDDVKVWVDLLGEYLYDYSWEWSELRVLPNAGLVFIRSIDTANKIVGIINEFCLKGLTEEFGLFKLANCTLNEYISKFEPSVVCGRPDHKIFKLGNFEGNIYKQLNDFIKTKVAKREYLIHF